MRGLAGRSRLPRCYNYACSVQRSVVCRHGAVAFPLHAFSLGAMEGGFQPRVLALSSVEGEGKGWASGYLPRPPISCLWAGSCIGSILLPGCWRSPGSQGCLKIVTDNKPRRFLEQFGPAGCCQSRWQQCLAAQADRCHALVSPFMPKLCCAGGVSTGCSATGPLSCSRSLVLLCTSYRWKQK